MAAALQNAWQWSDKDRRALLYDFVGEMASKGLDTPGA